MPTALETLLAFDVENSEIILWTFKKTLYTGVDAPVYTGHWVEISENLKDAIRDALVYEIVRITEVLEYGILAQNNEGSALSIEADETYAGLILEKIGDEVLNKKIKNLKEINNSAFYVLKVVAPDRTKFYAARKTDDSWHSRKSNGTISALFGDDSLDINYQRNFNISNHVDFFIVEDKLIISGKANFESVLSYKQAHLEDFTALTQQVDFSNIFSNVAPVVEYVGKNKIRLRRALAIHQKGHYKDPAFMGHLRINYTDYGLALQFDQNLKLVVTEINCRDVFTALLDHRLKSPFSQNVYDVQDTNNVVI
ncbi:hypothetical protein VM94_04516 [Janthinobacterium sp. KBS0711]|uniref:Kiwa anti-phage protein KwaB-like domain-containing protein n=1 Tax=Janthinobacterium sp. KBS0711 TaxID=1649647 RepID=UPI000636F628|nr:Kiwa anti-phage protein KwaB-like domain-containing protein [Janthinobacterium sp. KBS0711]KKO62442.1 hypothetical protein VM94_04516 [Janthinobacterium sp. KBS0711]TSD70756.1 DUF4868 domain-containing protein [Janthinobacterium sp. KBS0711]